ncbi:MAG: NADH oxidoreductase (quinone) subunit F [Candidatus Dadabacteria bacterium]|nr:MAG: NADH oxidoreductase (quinone) subunit F [Candidatus Dadabacteria bacterium]
MAKHRTILLKNIHEEGQHTLSGYESRGGYQAIRKVLDMDPLEVVEEVKKSGLRGRGGAGFPTGLKWSFVPRDTGKPVYIIMNSDESEPGTFKDRVLLERDPHLCIEGIMIAAWALQSHVCFNYVRGEYAFPFERFHKAVSECYEKGYLGKGIFGSSFDLDIIPHRGAGAYICGEETGLIESLSGNKGQPRLKPPYPAVVGLYGCPTVVNNTESLASLPWILNNGGEAYAEIGTEKSTGTKLFSVSGHVKKPGVYEIELGYPLLEFLEDECGGMLDGSRLKAIIPGGSSVPALRADELDGVNLDYESLQAAGTLLGSGGFMVLDHTVDMLDAALNFAHFYSHESCGQCTPCREGGHWIEKILQRIASGNGRTEDIDLIKDLSSQIGGHTICPFGDALITPVLSYIEKFPDDFYGKIKASERYLNVVN